MTSTDKEVRGKDASVTLLSIIEANELDQPNLMSYNDWQKWRKETNTRPQNKDGERLAPIPNIAPLIAMAPPHALDQTLKANSPSFTSPPTRAETPMIFKLC